MEIRLLEKDKEKTKISFLLKNSSPSYANALRRFMINKVPTMAIEDVEIRQNSSAMYDETIAHRLGLLPLTTDLKSYKLPSKCKCEGKGCAQCQVKFTLKAKGPCTVYAKDIKSKDPEIKPVYPETPIVKLAKNQELELEATGVLGVGKEHIKWCPCLAYYKHKADISVDSKINQDAELCQEIAKQCPQKIFEFKNNKLIVVKDNELKCILCETCAEISKGLVSLNKEENSFIFFIESWGQLDCKQIVKKTIEVFDDTLENFITEVKSIK